MFLAPLNRKSILDLFVLSSQVCPIGEAIRTSSTRAISNQHSTIIHRRSKNQSLHKQTTKVKTFVIKSLISVLKVFITLLALVRIWMNYSLTAFLSVASKCFISYNHGYYHPTELSQSNTSTFLALPALTTDTSFSDNHKQSKLQQLICLVIQLFSYLTPHSLLDNQSSSSSTTTTKTIHTRHLREGTNFLKVCSGAKLTGAGNNWSETRAKPAAAVTRSERIVGAYASGSSNRISSSSNTTGGYYYYNTLVLGQCECNNHNCSTNTTNGFAKHTCRHQSCHRSHPKMDFYQARRIAQRAVSAQTNIGVENGKHADSRNSASSNPSGSCYRDYSARPEANTSSSRSGSRSGDGSGRPLGASTNNGFTSTKDTSARMAMVGADAELEAAKVDYSRRDCGAGVLLNLRHAALLSQGRFYESAQLHQRTLELASSPNSNKAAAATATITTAADGHQLVSTTQASTARGCESIGSGMRRQFPQFAQQQQQQHCRQLHKQEQKQHQLEKSLHHNLQTANGFKYATCAEGASKAEHSSSPTSSSSSSAVSSLIRSNHRHHHHHQQQQQQQPQRQRRRLDNNNKQGESVYDNALLTLEKDSANDNAAPTHIEQGRVRNKNENNDLLGAEAGSISERRQNNNNNNNNNTESVAPPLLLISKSELSDLTEQIALSLNKMKDLEEQVRIIPDLQRRLDQVVVMSDSCSSSVTGKDFGGNINSSSNNIDNHNSTSNSIIHHQAYQANHSNSHQHHHHHNLHNSAATRFNSVERASGRESSRLFNNLDNGDSSVGSISSKISSLTLDLSGNNDVGRGSNRNLNTSFATTSTEDVFKGIHPLLQRHYHSFRQQQQHQTALVAASANKQQSSTPLAPAMSSASASYATSSDNSISSSTCTHRHQQYHNHHTQQHPQHHGTSGLNFNNNNNHQTHHSTSHTNINMNLANGSARNNHQSSSHISSSRQNSLSNNHFHNNHATNSGSLSLQTTPVKSTPLDCGCQSFKEHLKYNTISREQRLNSQQQQQQQVKSFNHISSHTSTSNSNIVSPAHIGTPVVKVDVSTNTDLTMHDVVTKEEMNTMMVNMQKTFSNLSTWILSQNPAQNVSVASSTNLKIQSKLPRRTTNETKASGNNTNTDKIIYHKSSSLESESTSGSMSGPKSSSPLDSRSTDEDSSCNVNYDEARVDDEDELKSECSSNKGIVDESEEQMSKQAIFDEGDNTEEHVAYENKHNNKNTNEEQEDDDDDEVQCEEEEEEEEDEGNSVNSTLGEEPYSLGSSYQDPSDFEEYCAYGESLDRRTKDFMSQSTKIPNDLRFALIRLNDFIKRNCSFEQIESSSNCIDVIRKDWFKVASNKDSQPIITKLYVDYFESFTKQLLNTVVNLTDSAGNTALHYAASHYKLDIIKVLLGTKVCDVNCRNKAGYTSIMLLALGEIPEKLEEQEIARCLFSIGDVNIKARSSGQTALMLAASHGRATTCRLLLECGADPSLKDLDGSTALMCGSEIGDEKVVRCLLAHKSTDPTVTDNDGLDALTIAMNNGHKSIGLILYSAKNVPRMARSKINQQSNNQSTNTSTSGQYSGGSLRKGRGNVMATSSVRRTAFTGWSKR